MYILLLTLLLGLGIGIATLGYRRDSRGWMLIGAAIALLTIAFFALLDFWGEMLWFDALGHADRFWTLVGAQVAIFLLGAVGGLIGVYLLTRPMVAKRPKVHRGPVLAGAVGGGLWGLAGWDELLLFLNRVSTDQVEPILGQDTGFYLFILPLLDSLFWLLLWIAVVGLATALAIALDLRLEGKTRPPESSEEDEGPGIRPLLITSVFLALVLALGKVLDVYHLLYSQWGVVSGPGWTDVHVRLPAYWIIAVLTLLLGMAPLLPALRRRLGNRLGEVLPVKSSGLIAIITVWIGIGAIWLIGLRLVPPLVQWLVVEPNEITLETPYIAHNIRFTRQGFRLHEVEERQFPAGEAFTRQMAEDSQHLLSEVRLWDWRALDAVYKQFQEIRLYYEFKDIDVDRYILGDRYRQVMVSAREMMQSNLPPQSQTFVNQRFIYTHGYGLTMAMVSDFTEDGLPNLLIKDIPPQSEYPELQVERPQIYYGELTTGPVVVNSQEREFDYPHGEENVYIRYPGTGGVQLSNLWRKFVFGWKFDGTRFLLSGYPTAESRILLHRQISERVATLAPFLQFDADPYIVLAEGRLYWIIDAYTTSRYYPYSEPFSSREFIEYRDQGQPGTLVNQVAENLDGVNYVRNSVKAVVDAFNGSVDFYIFEPQDPLIQAWSNAFPNLFKPRQEMPEALQAHVRYPRVFCWPRG